jgi:hypothetical protein
MLLEDILEVIIVLASEYILILLDDINSLNGLRLFLLGLLDVLANGLTLLPHLPLRLLLPLLLLLPLGLQPLDLLSSQLSLLTHALISTIYRIHYQTDRTYKNSD